MTGDPEECSGLESDGRTQYLAGAAAAGDTRHFDELFLRVAPALQAWFAMRTPRGRGIEPADLTQEVWVRALQAFSSFDPSRSFRAWILGIAKNVLLQGLARPAQRPLENTDPSSSSSGIAVVDPLSSVGRRFARDEALERFLERVERLEPDERALVLYCGLEEYTSAQAARRLGLSAEATAKRWQTLRARLRADPEVNRLVQALFE
jgi:RNA polymerase sigma factor (sigma-70 family)